ncbi:hypothetical protein ACO0E1_00735 [Curtobacterium sp. RRHDQ66]|uniref:8-oxoguanine DNA glycosylase n=1 Tax=Curtobacterium guangdongense TaxID=3413380 RepID=UPI003BF38521
MFHGPPLGSDFDAFERLRTSAVDRVAARGARSCFVVSYRRVVSRCTGSYASGGGSPTEDVRQLRLIDGSVRPVRWGLPWHFQSPAYWIARTEEWLLRASTARTPHRLGVTFAEEVIACLLGGHGITYEANVAAFRALRADGLLAEGSSASAEVLYSRLVEPIVYAGRSFRYRFPRQKAARIAAALDRLRFEQAPPEPLAAREWLLTFPGVGLKTASWVVRNHFGSADVAIIDIHLMRAGVRAGVFDGRWTPAKDYRLMESAFISWADVGGVPAQDLDAVVWMDQAAAARRRPAPNRSQLLDPKPATVLRNEGTS